MATKKSKPKKTLALREPKAQSLTVEQVMAHPAVVEMSRRLQAVHELLPALPEMIGRAVAQAMRSSGKGLSAPAIQVSNPESVEITPQKLTIDGKTTELPKTRQDVGVVSKYLTTGKP